MCAALANHDVAKPWSTQPAMSPNTEPGTKIMDEERLNQFVGKMLGDIGGAASVSLGRIGDVGGLQGCFCQRHPGTGLRSRHPL
jgi:hypothetical protein